MNKAIITLLILSTTPCVAQVRFICHKPLGSDKGADLIAEVDTSSSGSKKTILESGPIYIKLWDGPKTEFINTEIMSGQSTLSQQYLAFTKDLRVHTLILTRKQGEVSSVKINRNKVVVEYPTNCTDVPKIPKKK